MSDEKFDLADLKQRMEGAVSVLRSEFKSLRTGRASPALLEKIMVMAYGVETPLPQISTISVPESRMLAVNVWDKTLAPAADKAIRDAQLGLNPVMDGQNLRVPVPPLNEQRRAELAKQAGRYAENARIAVRNVRRDGMDTVKALEKDSEIGRDQQKSHENSIQKLTDEFIARIDEALKGKESEIMQV